MTEHGGPDAVSKKNNSSEVHVVVEVDGTPVGVLDLDVDRLWSVINHHKRDSAALEWVDRVKFDSVLQAAVMKRLIGRLEQNLYRVLGNEIVKAELDIEGVMLKAENAAQVFGRTQADVERVAAESQRTVSDFHDFFWDHLLDDRESVDIRKEWKATGRK